LPSRREAPGGGRAIGCTSPRSLRSLAKKRGATPPSTIVGTDWLNVEGAARYLGITPRTLYRLIDTAELPAYRVGRVIRLRIPEIEAFIQSCRIQPGELRHLYPSSPDTDDGHER